VYCRQAAIALLFLAGCRQTAPVTHGPQRTAVLRFENLGSADADWQGRALSEVLKRSFGADRMPRSASAAPGISTERLAAISAGATQLITGYYTAANGTLEVAAFAEDPATQKISGPVRASGSLSDVAAVLAREFHVSSHRETQSGLNASSPALREYALASDTAGPAAIPHYELAVAADPGFGPAYLGLIRSAIAQNNTARAQQALAAASGHLASFSKEDRAYLQLESATLTHDNQARIEALSAINSLGLPEAEALQALGDAEMAARKPAEAAKHYSQAIALAPADANLRNLLTYASLYAGDEAGARAAAREYSRLRPQDPNTFDTAGDVELAYGHFAEAEKIYLSTPDAAFQNYLPGWKAARARLMAGDLTGATTLFEKHHAALRKAGNPLADYRAAEWLSLTAHRAEAANAMAAFAQATAQPERRSAAYAQAAIWAVLDHNDARAIPWSNAALKPAQASTFVFAAIARFLAQPKASAAEWRNRAEASFPGANAAEVRRLAFGLALLQSRDFPGALPVWKQIYESTSVNEAAPAYLYGWALRETGHASEAAPLLRLRPIPASGFAPSFEALYLPLRQ